MAGSPPQQTHAISYILMVENQHFLILKPLNEEADEVVVSIDEVLASHLIGAQDVELRTAN
jgi:hypothetical protein